jgi:hypothetical protein
MRLRFLFLLVALGILIAVASLARKIPVKAQGLPATQNVSLGVSSFSPPTTSITGSSTLTVAVATGTGVPAVGADKSTPIKAVVQIAENNASGIAYTVTPSQLQTVDLAGGGRVTPIDFTFAIDSKNTRSGTIAYRATLVELQNNAGLAQMGTPATSDATLTVAAPTPTPTPTPTPPPSGGSGCTVQWFVAANCPDYDFDYCYCPGGVDKSPVVVDINGDGIALTDREHGVNFDMDGDGFAERVSWTAPDSDDAFLFLDRNEDAKVNNCTELFGNMTPQPYAPDPNGFVALAMYDTPMWGGNGDGVIDSNDAVYFKLRLWQDKNHDGISQPEELHTLPELGVTSISLDYKESKSTDQYGNRFRYRAKVERAQQTKVAHWAWDVFLR